MSFGRIRQRIVLKCAQHDYFFSFNQSDRCFLTSSLPLSSTLLKLHINLFLQGTSDFLSVRGKHENRNQSKNSSASVRSWLWALPYKLQHNRITIDNDKRFTSTESSVMDTHLFSEVQWKSILRKFHFSICLAFSLVIDTMSGNSEDM